MKKLNDANMGIFVLLSVCLCLFSCNNDNDNLPKDYAGFEHSKETVECESDKSECELKIKIVADFLPALMITFFSVSCTTAACPTTGGGVASTTVRSSFVFSVATNKSINH